MKKLFTLLFTLVFIYSCDESSSVVLQTNSDFGASFPVQIPKTDGTPATYNEMISQNLNQIISNFDNVKSLTITALSYQFLDVSGNTNAVIQNASFKINGIDITTFPDLNPTEVQENIYTIENQSILNQIKASFLSSDTVSVEYTAEVLSDEGPVNFTVFVGIGVNVVF